jgi:membrane protease YdiL (CAAX protease family)
MEENINQENPEKKEENVPEQKLKFLTNNVVYIWTLILIAVPTLIFSSITDQTTINNIILILLLSTGIVLIMLFGSVLIFRRLGEHSNKANYILSVNIAIVIYHLTSILGIFFDHFFGISDKVFTFIQPILVLVGSIFAIKYYHLNLNLNKEFIDPKKIILAISIGMIFGLIFWVIKEPISYLFSNTIPIFIVYTLIVGVSEELLFRFVIFKLAEKTFAYNTALWLQAVVFACVHFIYFKYLIYYYQNTPTILAETAIVSVILYFIALIIFGYVCGKLVGIRKSETLWENGNIVYAIIVHWITNFVTMLLFFI